MLSLFIVNGCSDDYPKTGKISIENKISQKIKISFFDKEIYQDFELYKKQWEDILSSSFEAGDVNLYFNTQEKNSLSKIIQDKKIYLEKAESEWITYKNNQSSIIEDKIIKLKDRLLSLDNKNKEVIDFLKPYNDKVSLISNDIKSNENKISEIRTNTINNINETIKNNNLPIKLFSENAQLFNSNFMDNYDCSKSCHGEWEIVHDKRDKDGRGKCYCLKLPTPYIKNTPSIDAYKKYFDDYMSIYFLLGNRNSFFNNKNDNTLYSQLDKSKDELRNAEIIAENKFGKYKDVENEIKIKNIEKKDLEEKLNTLNSDSEKEKFISKSSEKFNAEMKDHYLKYIESSKRYIFNKSIKIITINNSETFELPKKISYMLIEVTTSNKNGEDKTLYSVVDLKNLNKNEKTLTITDDYFNFNGSQEPDSLYSFLIDRTIWASDNTRTNKIDNETVKNLYINHANNCRSVAGMRSCNDQRLAKFFNEEIYKYDNFEILKEEKLPNDKTLVEFQVNRILKRDKNDIINNFPTDKLLKLVGSTRSTKIESSFKKGLEINNSAQQQKNIHLGMILKDNGEYLEVLQVGFSKN